jgi:hypothetical protein
LSHGFPGVSELHPRKADRGTVLALRKREITPYVDRRARVEVLRDAVEGKSAERPWEKQIQSRQEAIRRRYLDYASEQSWDS